MSSTPSSSHPPSIAWQPFEGGVAHMVTSECIWIGSTKFGDKDESDDWDRSGCPPPPPPPKELHDKYGIEYCHASLQEAIKKANSGDTIYLEDGHFDGYTINDKIYIEKNVEIIGLGDKPEDTIVDVGSFQGGGLALRGAQVRLANFTIRCAERTQSSPPSSQDYADPLVVVETRKAKLTFLENIVFEMGSEQAAAVERKRKNSISGTSMASFHRNILSGIHIRSGENIVLHKCKFHGGNGAAITVMHEPLFHAKIAIDDEVVCGPARTIELVECTIQSSGEPWSKSRLLRSRGHDEDDTILPGPGAIELWSIRRDESDMNDCAVETEGPGPMHTIRLAGNTLANNFRAPIVYRVLEPHSQDKTTDISVVQAQESTDSSSSLDSHHLHQLGPFNLVFQGNAISNNGHGLVSSFVTNGAKKAKVEATDGTAVLTIESDAYDPDDGSWSETDCIYSKLGDLWNEVTEIEKYWW